jgi:hypothetical protein
MTTKGRRLQNNEPEQEVMGETMTRWMCTSIQGTSVKDEEYNTMDKYYSMMYKYHYTPGTSSENETTASRMSTGTRWMRAT